jgi:hypothetical protein
MQIQESKRADGTVTTNVQFVEHRLEEIMERLNRLKRADEKPFQAVAALSEFNQRAYELFARPVVQACANKACATLGRLFNPLRLQRWAASDMNPWTWWLIPVTKLVKEHRQPASPEHPIRRTERMASTCVSASLDLYRDLRDALSEAMFFSIYGSPFMLSLAGPQEVAERESSAAVPPREMPYVREALAAIDEGSYPEALARVASLLAHNGSKIPLSRIELKEELLKEYRSLIPDLPRDQMRRIRGEQEIIVRYEPERAIAALPQLLVNPTDRARLMDLLDRLLADRRIIAHVTPGQHKMIKRIQEALAKGRKKQSRQPMEVVV